ncbi:MAG: LuxR C-terminal-related transcriptional regulator [Candidatus Kapaibacterium sp.]|jgi:DNA-binding CsgD family transcriptional regulator
MQFQVIEYEELDMMTELMHTQPELSVVELRVWSMVKRGLTSREIAGLLGCSVRNIQNHRYRISKKQKMGTAR